MKRLLVVSFALVFAAVVFAEGKRNSTAHLIIADGNTDVSNIMHARFEADFIAGTGTLTFTCRLNPGAPFLAFDAAFAMGTCTGDCIRPSTVAEAPNCETIRVAMSGCAACNVKLYVFAAENRTQ